LHPNARKEAEATECAFDQGGNSMFWQYIDELYSRTPSNNGLALTELGVIAEDVGLDVEKFESCLDSGKYAKKVQEHYEDAVRSGGRGTPHSILITRTGESMSIQGAQPYDILMTVIDAALAEQGLE